MHWLLPIVALVLVLVQFIWMKLDAVAVRVISLTAHGALLSAVTGLLGGDAGIHVEVLE